AAAEGPRLAYVGGVTYRVTFSVPTLITKCRFGTYRSGGHAITLALQSEKSVRPYAVGEMSHRSRTYRIASPNSRDACAGVSLKHDPGRSNGLLEKRNSAASPLSAVRQRRE